jgi:hypothetical protein
MTTVNDWGVDLPVPDERGGTGTATATQGDILYASATDTLSKLAAGTENHVLTVATDLPNWEATTAGSGGWIPLAQATASSSATINFDSTYITTTYDVYVVQWFDLVPADSGIFELLYSTDDGSSMESTNYACRAFDKTSTTASTSTSEMVCHATNFTNVSGQEPALATYWICNPASSGTRTHTVAEIYYPDGSSSLLIGRGYAKHGATEAHNYIRFQFSGGNTESGTAYLWGLEKP